MGFDNKFKSKYYKISFIFPKGKRGGDGRTGSGSIYKRMEM